MSIRVDERGNQSPAASVALRITRHQLAGDVVHTAGAGLCAARNGRRAARSVAVANATLVKHRLTELNAVAVEWCLAPHPHRHLLRLMHVARAVLIDIAAAVVADM